MDGDPVLTRIDLLISIKAQQASLDDEYRRGVASLEKEIIRYLRSVGLDVAQHRLSEIYWQHGALKIRSIIRSAWSAVFNSQFKPNPLVETANCRICGGVIVREIDSQTRMDQTAKLSKWYGWNTCRQCKDDMEDKRYKEEQEARRRKQEEISRLKSLSYADYLKSDHWSEVRRKMLYRASYKCQLCNATGLLDVHHRTYERLGCESYSDLIVLCRDCHSHHHKQ